MDRNNKYWNKEKIMGKISLCNVILFLTGIILLYGGASAVSPPNRYVEIEINGPVNEKPELYEFIFPRYRTMKQYLDLMEKARDDPEVGGLILKISQPRIGWAKVQQIRRAIHDFRKSGKKAYALITGESLSGYLMACSCDKITLIPSSPLMMSGLRMESYYLKDLLAKLGIEVDVIPIGKYKTAAESFTNSSMSEASREMLTAILDDYYNQLIAFLVEDRNLTTDTVQSLLDEGPFAPQEAKEKGLVDSLGYDQDLYQEIENGLTRYLKVDKEYDRPKPEAPAFNIFTLLFRQPVLEPGGKPKSRIALIVASGAIVPGQREDYPFQEEIIAAGDLIEQIRECIDNPAIVAIILRIDSPGGSAMASDMIWRMLQKAREKKPVIASLSDVAASGGYYIAVGADKIVAEPGTITGSIGVITGKPVLAGLFEKIGINVEVISRGKNSGLFSPLAPFSETQRSAVEKISLVVYNDFVDKVSQSRRLSKDEVLSSAEGRVWTGKQAYQRRLVDDLGGIERAVFLAKDMAGIPPGRFVEIEVFPRQLGLFEFIQEILQGAQFTQIQAVPPNASYPLFLYPSIVKQWMTLYYLFQSEPSMAVMPFNFSIR
jgi:protease-4